MSDVVNHPKKLSKTRRIWSRIGLVLAALMSLGNVAFGIWGFVDPASGHFSPTVTVWLSVYLLVSGLVTLIAIVPAWRDNRIALWTVIISRLQEGWSVLVLPFAGNTSDAILPIVFATVVSGLVALALHRH